MNISKIKVIAKYLTGGIANVIEYLLDLFNEMIQKLPKEEVAKYAQLAKDIAIFVSNCCVLIKDEKKKIAAQATAQCFADLATALLDSSLTKDELDSIIISIKAAVDAWKNA